MSGEEEEKRYVITYLLTRLCDEYKLLMSGLKDPAEIIAKLEDLKYPKLLSMKLQVKRQWMNLVYEMDKENGTEFL